MAIINANEFEKTIGLNHPVPSPIYYGTNFPNLEHEKWY